MARNDRFLLAIIAGAAVLVVVALVLARRAGPPEYVADDTPEGVAFNYVLAVQRGDMERALGYLSPDLDGYPGTAVRFQEDLRSWGGYHVEPSATFRADPARMTADRATVAIVQTTFNEGGLFGSSEYTDRFEMGLQQVDGAWMLVSGDRFWDECWSRPERCRDRRGWVPPPPREPAP